jgi:phosphopantothenoylcysteine synthetase/decarboxylase
VKFICFGYNRFYMTWFFVFIYLRSSPRKKVMMERMTSLRRTTTKATRLRLRLELLNFRHLVFKLCNDFVFFQEDNGKEEDDGGEEEKAGDGSEDGEDSEDDEDEDDEEDMYEKTTRMGKLSKAKPK